MNSVTLYLLSSVGIFVVCFYGLVIHAHLIRKILALNMMGSAVFLLLTGVARRGELTDPVPHAMVLTGIVVAVSATAFALAVTRRLYEESGRTYLPEEDPEGSPEDQDA